MALRPRPPWRDPAPLIHSFTQSYVLDSPFALPLLILLNTPTKY